MKGIRQLLVIAVIAFASACSSTQNSTTAPDDVYYSKGDAPQSPPAALSHPSPSNRNADNSGSTQSQGNQSPDYAQNPSSSEQYKDQNGNTIINNYYNDDYYDYSYSSRLRRYYSPMPGYGFYDPFYTNMYFYDYNPYSYGVSIYLGYHFWAPSIYYYNPFFYGPSVSFGYGWGYSPYYSPFYNPWHYPYGGYGYYGSPYGGYGNPYYYNSFDGTSTSASYYGPRGSVSGTGRSASPAPRTLGEKYQQAVAENRIPASTDGTGRSSGTDSPVRKNIEKNSISNGTTRTGEGRENVNEPGGTRINQRSPEGEVFPIPENNRGQVSPNVKPEKAPAEQNLPSRNFQPGNESLPNSNGGTTRPKPDRQTPVPQNQVQSESNPAAVPRNNNDVRRNKNVSPNFDFPKQEKNYDRPRQYQQAAPQIEQRQEQRQYKQESPQPRQQQNYSQPERKSNSAPSENRGSGRRK